MSGWLAVKPITNYSVIKENKVFFMEEAVNK